MTQGTKADACPCDGGAPAGLLACLYFAQGLRSRLIRRHCPRCCGRRVSLPAIGFTRRRSSLASTVFGKVVAGVSKD